MAESMAAITSPKSRMDLARFLRANENWIVTTLDYLGELYGLNIDKKSKLEVMLGRIRYTIRKANKSLESLDGDWWHSEACFKMFESSHDHIPMKPMRKKKDPVDFSLQQQRFRISSVLESIRSVAVIENTSEIKIAALALQLLCNEADNREVAKVSKSIVHDKFSGQFGHTSKNKELDVDKALFLLDLLEIGKRKYTLLRQLLLSSEIHFLFITR